ncbi:MAG: DNA mismatch repair protein MutS [Deltaproteobacteria bacterium]
MRQYFEAKEQYSDCIIFFRMGDFYEMFFDDAIEASKVLEITLTTRNKNKEDSIPLCGIPYHAADGYIAKLIANGYKVAICEQMEDPKLAKGVVKRDVIRVVTPGLVLDANSLVDGENNFLIAINHDDNNYGYALIDITTGEAFAGNAIGEEMLKEHLTDFTFSEAVISQECGEIELKANNDKSLRMNRYSQKEFSSQNAMALINKFIPKAFDNDKISQHNTTINAIGIALKYIADTQKEQTPQITDIQWHEPKQFLIIDDVAKTNLEIFKSLSNGGKRGTLLQTLDETITPMGARKFRRWLNSPLKDINAIAKRHISVGEIKDAHLIRKEIRLLLKCVRDVERLTGRITVDIANARDVIALKNSLIIIPQIKKLLVSLHAPFFVSINERLDDCCDIVTLIGKAIHDEPPATIREGNIIKKGYDNELDEIISISRDGKKWIATLEDKERKRTGIASLKIGFNNIFGYYIEVTKTHTTAVPPEYIRKQTLVNAERYINEELKGYEETVLNAEEKRREKEYDLFSAVRKQIGKEADRLRTTATAISELDCITSLAEIAQRYGYCRPEVYEGDIIDIKDGRHPVVEQMNLGESFVPNDTLLDLEQNRLLIITGPNMAGKSTYIRQVALIVIMAQMGSFVPASYARIGIADRVFTRIGAADNLARGQSTFMVEMVEVANILNNATSRSLIILDEVGRGTSTFDGMSIAWAVAEHLLDETKLGARALFATHYHQLTELAAIREGVKNYNIAVKEYGEKIIFLRKIINGGTNRSYGIQVARLAGIPTDVINRAKEILSNLERNEFNVFDLPQIAESKENDIDQQTTLFGKAESFIIDELQKMDTAMITPLEALNIICTWQDKIKK